MKRTTPVNAQTIITIQNNPDVDIKTTTPVNRPIKMIQNNPEGDIKRTTPVNRQIKIILASPKSCFAQDRGCPPALANRSQCHRSRRHVETNSPWLDVAAYQDESCPQALANRSSLIRRVVAEPTELIVSHKCEWHTACSKEYIYAAG